jgi:hypothetical protein
MLRKKGESSVYHALRSIEKIFFAMGFIMVLFPVSLHAHISAGTCSNCHTMHNSQNGSAVAYDFDGVSFSLTDTPKDSLLIHTCLGCHSSTGTDTIVTLPGGLNVPIVFNTGGYPTPALAGGNFYYVSLGGADNDAKGHNVFAGAPEGTLIRAPGDTGGFSLCGTNSCHANIHGTVIGSTVGLNGRQGCTKCHMVDTDNRPKGFHHKDDTGPVIDTVDEGCYRFLKGHAAGSNLCVTGIEDDDWEFETSTDHNEYLGDDTCSKITVGGLFNCWSNTGKSVMTSFCSACHMYFHVQDTTPVGASPWLRHPADTVLPNSEEYSVYRTYDPIVPVARPQSFIDNGVSSNTVTPGQDMVMCLSCHRAHASPYFKMMRWDYRGWPGNAGTSGCSRCHTSKN